MSICEHGAQQFRCSREATTKHNGQWLCDWCYGLTVCDEGICSDECPVHGERLPEYRGEFDRFVPAGTQKADPLPPALKVEKDSE